MSELLQAVRGSDRVQPVAPGPASSGGHAPAPALLPGGAAGQQGELLRGAGHWTLILVNLDRRAVNVRAAAVTRPDGAYEQLRATPETVVSGPRSLERRRGRLPRSRTLVLAPYSLTRVWGR